MARMSDNDLTKESVQVQEFSDEVRKILNNGLYEIQVTTSGQPDYDAPSEPTIVLSLFGAQYRVYIGYNGSWYYTALTKL
jgi:hypothetical protein